MRAQFERLEKGNTVSVDKESENETPKQVIDLLREGAGSINVSVEEDDSEVTDMLSLGDNLIIVKRLGIYRIMMADQIDPARTNPDVSNTVQRITPFGSDEEFIGKILLTAYGFFHKGYLVADLDSIAVMDHVVEITKNIGEMKSLADRFAADQFEVARKFYGEIGQDRSLVIPSIGNVDIRVREYVQKVDHALQSLFDIVKLFYSEVGKGGWEGLLRYIDSSQPIDNFADFLKGALPFLIQIRSIRNAIEHERPDMRLVATDFSINARNELVPPLVKLVHPKAPLDEVPARELKATILTTTVDVVELMLVYLCARHIDPSQELSVQVVEIPEERRKSPNVRYGYGVMVGGQLVPLSK